MTLNRLEPDTITVQNVNKSLFRWQYAVRVFYTLVEGNFEGVAKECRNELSDNGLSSADSS